MQTQNTLNRFSIQFLNYPTPEPGQTFIEQDSAHKSLKLVLQIATKSELKRKGEKINIISFYCKKFGKQCFCVSAKKNGKNVYSLTDNFHQKKHKNGCELTGQNYLFYKTYWIMELKKSQIQSFIQQKHLQNAQPSRILLMYSGQKKYFYENYIFDKDLRKNLKKKFDNIINIDIKNKFDKDIKHRKSTEKSVSYIDENDNEDIFSFQNERTQKKEEKIVQQLKVEKQQPKEENSKCQLASLLKIDLLQEIDHQFTQVKLKNYQAIKSQNWISSQINLNRMSAYPQQLFFMDYYKDTYDSSKKISQKI